MTHFDDINAIEDSIEWPAFLSVQLNLGSTRIYKKTFKLRRGKKVSLNAQGPQYHGLYFPKAVADATTIAPLLFECQDSDIKFHIDPQWEGFYVTSGRSTTLNNQKETVNIENEAFGTIYANSYSLNWKIANSRPARVEPMAKGGFIRVLFHQTAEIQNVTLAAVLMLVVSSIFAFTASRMTKPMGYLEPLSESQTLHLLDKSHIQTAPEFVNIRSHETLLKDIVHYFENYASTLAGISPQRGSAQSKDLAHLTNSRHEYEKVLRDIIKTNRDEAQSKLTIPAVIGETQSTLVWRLLEKISFMHNSSRELLQSRKVLNAQLQLKDLYDYSAPENGETAAPAKKTVIPDIYGVANRLARKSRKLSQDDDYFFTKLSQRAGDLDHINIDQDFNLARFSSPNSLSNMSLNLMDKEK